MTERDGGAAHRARLVVVADFLDERSIDEDSVERRTAHLSERHVTGAEVVDEYANAVAAKLMQCCETRTSRRQHLLGDFEIELRRFDARFARRVRHVFCKTLGGEILATDVH